MATTQRAKKMNHVTPQRRAGTFRNSPGPPKERRMKRITENIHPQKANTVANAQNRSGTLPSRADKLTHKATELKLPNHDHGLADNALGHL